MCLALLAQTCRNFALCFLEPTRRALCVLPHRWKEVHGSKEVEYETAPIHCILLILATFRIHDCNRRIGLSVTFSDSACYWSVLKYLAGKQPARLGLCFEMLCPAKSQQARAPSQSYVSLSEFCSTSGTVSLQKYSVLKKSLAEGLLSSFKYFIKIPKWFF